jgi:hypothetical protein
VIANRRRGRIPLARPCGLCVIEAYAMALVHQNLAVAACGDKLASVKPLVEAALGVARGTPNQA